MRRRRARGGNDIARLDHRARPVRVGSRADRVRDAVAYCCRPRHLRRTLRIALVVGIVLTAINQLDVILRGDATAATAIKTALNFVVPFVVSNLGLLSGRRHDSEC